MRLLGPSFGRLEDTLEASGTLLGLSWGALEALLGLSRALLGPYLGRYGAPLGLLLEAIDEKKGGAYLLTSLGARKIASWGPLGALLGDLGRSWGRLGALLGPSWGGVLGNLGAIEKAKRREGQKQSFSEVFEGFGHLGGLLGRLIDHLKPS